MAVSVGVAVELALVVVVVVLGAGQRKPHAQVDSERLVKPGSAHTGNPPEDLRGAL